MRCIAIKNAEFNDLTYEAGEVLELPEGAEVPKGFLMMPPEQPREAPKVRYVCTRAAQFGSRWFEAGEMIELERGAAVPDGFMPTALEGPEGSVEVRLFFCLRPCTVGGRAYAPGELWDRPTEPPPEGVFAPLAERGEYEYVEIGGRRKAELRRKATEQPAEAVEERRYDKKSL